MKEKHEGVFKMRSVFKSIIIIMLAAALLIAFTACGKSNDKQSPADSASPNGSVTREPLAPANNDPTPAKTAAPLDPDASALSYTIDARAAVSSGKLDSSVASGLINGGLIMNNASITLPKDSKTMASTFRVLDVAGIKFEMVDNKVIAIQGVQNGACGENSHWVLKINDAEVNENADAITLNNGDSVVWIYVIG